MERYSLVKLTKRVMESELSLLSTSTLRQVLGVEDERTFFRVVADLVKNEVLVKIERDKYRVAGRTVESFEIANFLYEPSYVSLETALNYWGVLSQFPYEVTSVGTKKSLTKEIGGVLYSYAQMSPKYFGGFTKVDGFLIASAEKALFDLEYLASKGLKAVHFDEYDMSRVNKTIYRDLLKMLKK